MEIDVEELIYLYAPYVLVIVGGCLDLWSTLLGISVGLVESHPWFFAFPFMATCGLIGLIWLLQNWWTPPRWLREMTTGGLIGFSFYPFMWNLTVIFIAAGRLGIY